MSKVVVGDYRDVDTVEARVEDLTNQGFPSDSIGLIANQAVMEDLRDLGVAVDTDFNAGESDADNEGVWDRIKHSLGFEDDEAGSNQLGMDGYRQDVLAGNILVLVDEDKIPAEYRNDLASMNVGYLDTEMPRDAMAPSDSMPQRAADGDETIRLQEERLKVDKESVQAGEVVISKRVVETTETIDVPVRHEEVVVERRPVTDGTVGTADFSDEKIVIPVAQEKVMVSKEPVVTEEVHVTKKDVEDVKEYSASLRKEELDIDPEGNVVASQNQNQI